MKLKLLKTAIILPFLLIAIPQGVRAADGDGLSLTPPLMEVNATPGATSTLSITLTNGSVAAETVQTKFSNFSPGDDGSPNILADTDKTEYGMKDWLTAVPDFSIAAKASKIVSVPYKVPATAKNQTYYTTVLFSVANPTSASSATTAVGTLVFVNVGTPIFAGKVTDFVVTKSDEDGSNVDATLSMTIQNTGQYKFTPDAAIEIVDDAGTVVKTLEPEKAGSVLPQSSRIFSYAFKGTMDDSKNLMARPAATLPDGTKLAGGTPMPFITPHPTLPAGVKLKPTVQTTNKKPTKNDLLLYGAIVAGGLLVIALLVALIRVILKMRVTSKKVNAVHETAAPLPQTIMPGTTPVVAQGTPPAAGQPVPPVEPPAPPPSNTIPSI